MFLYFISVFISESTLFKNKSNFQVV